ncbi:hypothetical protein JAAARDRAFT_38267 [Jaapia argillacea MUCL 33604]|uniref:Galactose oxidase n=1 Tax=Jaapia argillacea MUCL 33604 TaxID=933084 RepID=A0A067PTH2_9AGAM|nr:hypothetical protein JAAARDRAFT_38267 [Jaapia argillacea MUCL 33604]
MSRMDRSDARPAVGALADVPEQGRLTPSLAAPSPRSPYSMLTHSASASTSTLPSRDTPPHTTSPAPSARIGPRNPSTSSSRTLGRDRERDKEKEREKSSRGVDGTPVAKRSTSAANLRPGSPATPVPSERGGKSKSSSKAAAGAAGGTPNQQPRIRMVPHLPSDTHVERAPATIMYWSRAPVYGVMPAHGMRAHSVSLVDHVAWLFGGCDEKGCWQDVYCFDTETMQWSHPEMLGDVPPPCRAHTATLVDRQLIVFGGGQGPVYYNSVYVLDTVTHRWTKPPLPNGDDGPAPRRAHTAVLYRNKIWVFGGGNGMQALNDLWTLDVGVPPEKMKWESLETKGRHPAPRGYHTSNLVGNVMVVVGGSDGRECFSDIWCLNLDSLQWTAVRPEVSYRRLSHSTTQVGSYLFIGGGHDGNKYTSELLLFNLVTLQYETRPALGRAPSPRGYHVSLLADGRVFTFGGFNGHDVYDDVYILDLAGAAYLPQVTSFKIYVD